MSKQLNVNLAFTADTKQAKKNIEDLQNSLKNISSIGYTKLKLTDDMQLAVNSAKELQAHINNAFNIKTGNLDLGKLNTSLKQSNTNLSDLGQGLLKAGVQGETAFMNIQKAIATSNVQIKQANGFLAQMGTTLANTIRWQFSSSIIHEFMDAIQTAVGYAQDLDESLNNIRIVTGQSADQMANFAKEANKAAKVLSTTTTKYTDAALIYYQQGLDEQQVKERTDITIKMANVSRQSAEEVSDQMTAIWNNFYDGSQSLEHYADAMTKLGADTASSSDEIAQGLEKFAAIGDTIGLSFDNAAAALATVTATTRQSADVVGTAFKTIFARIQGLSLGDTLEDGTNLNKYSEALNKVGISIFEQNGELKAMDNILAEMGAKWETLSKAQQTALAQTVAGVRQYTQLVALMDNFDFYQQNLSSAMNADGTLQTQADIYADSWEASRERVQASLEKLYDELIPTKFIIGLNDAISDVLNVVGTLTDGFGGIGNILLLLSNIALRKFGAEITSGLNLGIDKANSFISFFGNLKEKILGAKNATITLKDEFDTINQKHEDGLVASTEYLHESLKKSTNESLKFSASMNEGAANTKNLSNAFTQYLNDTNQVYSIQNLIEQNTKNLTNAERERLSIQQQELLTLADERKELQTQLDLLKQQQTIDIATGDENLFANEKYQDAYSDSGESSYSALETSLNKDLFYRYREQLGLQSDLDGDLLWSDNTEGIIGDQQKIVNFYNEIETINARINDILGQQGVDVKDQLADIQQIVAENNIVSGIYDGHLNDQKSLQQIMARTTVEARRMAEGYGATKEYLNEVKKRGQEIGHTQQRQIALQSQWNQKIDETGNILLKAQAKFNDIGGILIKGIQGFGTIAMGISMASNAFRTLNDESADFSTKLSAIAFAVPAIFEPLKNVISNSIPIVKSLNNEFKLNNDLSRLKEVYQALINEGMEDELALEMVLDQVQKQGFLLDGEEITLDSLKNLLQKEHIGQTLKEIIVEKIKQSTKAETILILLAIVAATAAVIGITAALIKAYNKEEEANKKAQEQLQATNQTLSNTKQKYQEVIDTINKYEESIKALDNIRKGTEEWDEAVQKLNSDVLELLKSYSGLAQYVSEDEDGVLSISDEGFDWLKEQQRQTVNKAEVASYNAAIAANNAEDDWNTTRITREAGLATTTLEAGVKALQADPTLYASQGAELYDRISQALYGKDYMAGEETAGVIVAIANAQEEVTNLANELKANTKANEILGKQVSESYLKQSQDYLDANEDAQNAANLLLTNKLAGKDFTGRNGRTKMESYEDYARYMGWDVINIDKQKGYAEYTLADGSTEKVYLDIARQALNQQEYVNGIQDEINTFVNNIDKLERNIKTADDYQNYKSAITQEGLAAGLTQDQITNILYNSEQAGRFAKIDDITNEMLTKGLTSGMQKELFQKSLDELSDEELSLAIDVLPSSESLEEFKDNLHSAIIVVGRQDIESIFAAGEEELGISAEALESYAETLMSAEYQQTNFNELSQEGQRQYIENAKAAANAAVANYRLAIGINKVQKAFSDHIDVLTEGNEASLDFHEAIGELTIAMKEAFGMKVDAKFVKENLQLIKEMSEGSEQALVDLRNKLNEDFILKLEFEDNTLNQELLTTLEQLQQEALKNSVGTTLQLDNDKAIAALNEALVTGQATIEDIQAMFNNANLQMPKYKTKSIPGDAVTSRSDIEFTGPLGMTWKASSKTTTTTDRVVPYFGDNAPEVDDDGNITSYGGGGSLAVTTSGPASMSDLNEIIEYDDEDNADAIKDKNFENLQKALEFKLKIDDSELKKLEYLLNKYSDEFFLLSESMEKLLETVDNRKSILSIHKDYVKDLEKAYKSGQISQEDYLSGLEEAKSAIYEQLNALIDLDKQMKEYYENTLDQADEELEDHIDHLDHLTEVFEHYVNLMDIFGKSKDYEAMGDFLQGQADVTKDRLDIIELYYDSLIKEKAEVEKLLAEAIAQGNEEAEELYTIMLDNIVDKVDETQNEMLELTEEWAEAMKKVLENTFDKLADELEKALTNGIGFDEMLNDFDLLNQSQEEFLTKTNQVYETNKLMRTATKAMDDTSNKVAKQKIKNYIEETKKLQNNTKLSKYELEIQQAKYDLLLAEIALEEAQNAKSTVRLQRDSAGNFGYVYTADQDTINDAQQQLEDAENNLYNIQFEGQQNVLTKYVEAEKDYTEAILTAYQDRASGEISSDEELNQKLSKLQEQYYGPEGILTNLSYLYNLTLQDQTNATAENLLNQYGFMTEAIENHSILVNQYIGQMDSTWNNFQSSINQIHSSVQTDLNDSATATKNLTDESEKLADTIENTLLPEITKEIEEVRKATSEYALQREELVKLTEEYENYINTLNTKITKVASTLGSGEGNEPEKTKGSGVNIYPKKPIDSKNIEGSSINSGGEFDYMNLGWSSNSPFNSAKYDRWQTNTGVNSEPTTTTIDHTNSRNPRAKNIKIEINLDDRSSKVSTAVDTSQNNSNTKSGRSKGITFDTGGYTGDWGPEGKLAMLHEKELVLNAADTSNILSVVSIIREIARDIDARASISNLSLLTSAIGVHDTNQVLEQMVSIEASFPNATDRYEIEEAFNNLVNKAAQYANRKN